MSKPLVGPQGVIQMSFDDRQAIEDFTVPSLSKAYLDKDGKELFKDGVIRVSAMTVAEEKLLASNAKNPTGKIAQLLNKVCDLKALKADQLLLEDFHALLFKVRSISYGNIFPFNFKCPSCGAEHEHRVDIDTHPVTTIPENWSEFRTIDLPMSKSKVKLRSYRLKDSQSSAGKEDPYEIICKAIVEIDGEDPGSFYAAEVWMNNLLVRDRAAMTDSYKDDTPWGLDTSMDIECPSCGEVAKEVSIPMGEDFFRVT
jgi:rubredoxin